MAFRGVDYFCIDSLFSEQELMVRQTARQVRRRAHRAAHPGLLSRGALSRRTDPRTGGIGFSGRQPGRLRLRRHEQRRVRADHAGAGARRFRRAQLRLRAGRAGDVSDPQLTGRTSRRRNGCRGCRAGRRSDASGSPSRISVPIRRACAPRARPRRRRLDAERREDLDHQRQRRPMWPWCGRAPRRAFCGFLVERGTPGYTTSDIHGKWSMRASVTSSLALADCRVRGVGSAARRARVEGAAVLPDPGALRDRLGRDRRGHGLLRDRPRNTPSCENSSTTAPSPRTNWCRKSWPG